MQYVIHMTDTMGKSKIKGVDANTVKEAESKAKRRFPSYEIGRISQDKMEIDYYSTIKRK
jgi:hypothetical protein